MGAGKQQGAIFNIIGTWGCTSVSGVLFGPSVESSNLRSTPNQSCDVLDYVHTLPVHFENGEKYDGNKI